MRRTPLFAPVFALAAAALIAAPASGPVSAGRAHPCPGTVELVEQTLVKSEQLGSRTLSELTYTATHTLCPVPSESIVAEQTGRLWFNLDANGTGTVRFSSIVAYEGGTIRGDGHGTVGPLGITGRGHAYGGTGALSGVHGSGEFWSTSPTSFGDLFWYHYPVGVG